jgi:hypothetical protein
VANDAVEGSGFEKLDLGQCAQRLSITIVLVAATLAAAKTPGVMPFAQ